MIALYLPLFTIAGLIAFLALLSWYADHRKNKNHQKLLTEFDDLVSKNNLTIDKKQTLNKNIIGIDKQRMKLVAVDNSKPSQQRHVINLADLAGCRLIKNKSAHTGHITAISLQLTFRQKNKPEIVFPVYNELRDDFKKLMRLCKKASYWEKTINLFRAVKV